MTLTPCPDDRDLPLADADVAVLRLWADAMPAAAPCNAYTLSRALATVVHQRGEIRRLRETVTELLTAPPGAPAK
jgi:hypothetical protein